MRITALTIAAVLFTGCGSDPIAKTIASGPPLDTPKCKSSDNTGDCKILVSISFIDGKCTVTVPADQSTVGVKKGAGDKWLWWKIDGAPSGEWVFTTNGIAPKSTTKDWADNFKNDKLSDDGTAFRWKNQNKESQAGSQYEYEINLINAKGDTCKFDPIIKNQA